MGRPDGRLRGATPRRPTLASLLARQVAINRATDGNWSLYASHRARVTELTLAALSRHPSGRICVLGAGNCNDLALAEVAGHTAEVHLVDADGAALERGLARAFSRRPPVSAGTARLVPHAGVELTGLVPLPMGESQMSITAMVERALAGPTLTVGQPFDVVLSAGLLTQLISLPVGALEGGDPALTPVVLAVRTGHLRLLARLLRPGGHAVLITDVVSSDTTPGLLQATDEALPHLLSEALTRRNFFTGANPASLATVLRTDPWLATAATESSLVGPWRWRVGPARVYLAIALTFRRAKNDP
jgi:hypothetical protein